MMNDATPFLEDMDSENKNKHTQNHVNSNGNVNDNDDDDDDLSEAYDDYKEDGLIGLSNSNTTGTRDYGQYSHGQNVVSFTPGDAASRDIEDYIDPHPLPQVGDNLKHMVDADSVCSSKSHTQVITKASYCERLFACFRTVTGWISNPYETYVDLMYHLFDSSFGMLMVYFTFFFYAQCLICALLIYLVGMIEPDCVVFDGNTLSDITHWFDACWTLSWTTYSTTGYGNTAPALSESDGVVLDGVEKCMFINTLLMVVSFVGIVYAGAAGAILYSKVEKIKGEGQVSFSDPCVIRFGSGLIRVGADDDDDGDDDEGDDIQNEKAKNLCPCPVLEFRILNHNHHTPKGVIANSTLHCLASVEDEREETHDVTGRTISNTSFNRVMIEEDSRVNLPRRFFMKMELTNGEHPFFRRCWTATHVIDEKSPLIRNKMRERILKNHGFWPARYNNALSIKRNLKFKQIIVNFTGVSKRTSKEVHAQRVYDICDVIVGYQFINVLNKPKEDSVVEVMVELLNDITEQNGNDEGEDLSKIID